MPSGRALTSSADCNGSYRHTSIAMSTPRNNAATSAANTSANPTLATVTSMRGVVWSRSPAGSRRTLARSSAATANAPATIGAWTRKIARHENSSVNTPPSAGPIAAPTAAASAHHRRPRPGPGTSATSTGNEPARSRAAPTPWAARAASNIVRPVASPATSEAAVNTAAPATTRWSGRTRRCSTATGTEAIATARA